MSNFLKKIREAIASFANSSNKEVESSDSLSSSESKPVPRKNARPVILADIPIPKKKDEEVQHHFRKRENAVACDVPAQLVPELVSKKKITKKKRSNNKPSKVNEKK